MKLRIVFWLAFATVFPLATVWGQQLDARANRGDTATAVDRYQQLQQRLDDVVRYEVQQKGLPAFSIALVVDDRLIWSAGYGFQDGEQEIPVTADTVYRVGSVSKLFTDIAVMQQTQMGRLDLDAPVQQYLPDFSPENPFDAAITLRQLMSHRSGLVRESPVGHYFDPDEPSIEETVASLNDTSLVYEPDTRTKYSNAAITVVGQVLQQHVGVPFSEHMGQAILKPLSMPNSDFERTPAIDAKLAGASMWTYDGRRFEAPKFALGTAPAGNLYSSVNDLSRLLICLFREGKTDTGKLLEPETLRQMTTPVKDPDGAPLGFGLGFQVQDFDGHQKIGHGGAVYGFSTQLAALPQRKIGVVAVAALDGSNGVVRRICDYALRMTLAQQDGEELPRYRRTGAVPKRRAQALVGTYTDDDGRARVVFLNDRLYLWRGSYRYELRSASDDGTILTDDPLGFGTVVRLDSEGNLVVDDRRYSPIVDSIPPPPAERWQGLIGEYGWDHNTLYILEKNGRLHALIEWFFCYPLKELGPDRFAFPDFGLYHGEELAFHRTDGVATHVVAAEVEFKRRETAADGETFKIKPLKAIEQLRRDALAATPPRENRPRQPDLVEVNSLDDSIKLDLRCATENNFMGSVFYKRPRALLQRPAAEALVRVHQQLGKRGLGILIHDAYRPWFVTKMFWDATPANLKDFVANPANGSRHNRGCAVDLTLYELESGQPIQMVAGYDEFSSRAFPEYPGGTSTARWYRTLLRHHMEAEGFSVYEFEWWHFDYQDWQQYPIMNVALE
jgi:CubicO group peptidase (beta-lactamase class C family)/D-alanyl-D-alanine dipeptidase